MSTTTAADGVFNPKKLGAVILASSAGTLIEWYDFYLFGVLGKIIGAQFFPQGDSLAGYMSTLALFATGFVVRPFGAVVFGSLGDKVGRKQTFLLTLLLMGGSTVLIGVLPGYKIIGMLGPLILLILRLVQGLALGGEYGGAATYVAEHCPDERRGYYTSFIQTTATLGLFACLLIILVTQKSMSKEAFDSFGWRIPFLCSAILVVFSYFIRSKMNESPLFARAKAAGMTSKNPLAESFGNPANLKLVLLALFGATAGQAVVWYTGQFYALSFMQTTTKIDLSTSYMIIAVALALGTPLFVVFGHLSDKYGRKTIIMAGLLLACLAYIPIYQGMYAASGFDASHPKVAPTPNVPVLIGLVWLQVVFVTMVYGPIAAYLVEMFPTRIRYTSMSLPYHLGNGVFGGFVPLVGTALAASTKLPTAGVWYPIGVSAVTLVVGSLFLPDLKNVKLDHHDDAGLVV